MKLQWMRLSVQKKNTHSSLWMSVFNICLPLIRCRHHTLVSLSAPFLRGSVTRCIHSKPPDLFPQSTLRCWFRFCEVSQQIALTVSITYCRTLAVIVLPNKAVALTLFQQRNRHSQKVCQLETTFLSAVYGYVQYSTQKMVSARYEG